MHSAGLSCLPGQSPCQTAMISHCSKLEGKGLLLHCRHVTDAEAEAVKKTEDRAKVWKTNNGSTSTSPNTTPNTSIEIVPKDAQTAITDQAGHTSSSLAEAEEAVQGELWWLLRCMEFLCYAFVILGLKYSSRS